MFILAASIFSLVPRQNFFLEPETGAAAGGDGGGGDAALIAKLPGGDMLAGATLGKPAEAPGQRADWTAENADEEEAEEGETRGEGEGAKPAEEQPAEVPTPTPEELMKDWPEAARTQVETLSKELTTLKTEKETLGKEVETLKSAQPAPVLAPTAEMPLTMVNDEAGLQQQAAIAKQVKSWAMRNLAAGGDMPKELYAAARGRKPEEVQDDELTFSAEQVAGIMDKAEQMATEVIPYRRQYLQAEAEQADFIAKTYPQYLDAKTEEGKLMDAFVRQFPAVKALPQWRGVLAATVRGHLLFQKEEAERAAKAAGKTTEPPLAPAPVTRSAAAPNAAANGKPPSQKPKRTVELSASMNSDDLARLM